MIGTDKINILKAPQTQWSLCLTTMSNLTSNPPRSQDEPADANENSRIWTPEEKAILRSHIEGYHSSPKNFKAKYVAKKVIPEIKACWRGRYDKKKLKSDEGVRKEWEKKKEVTFYKVSLQSR